MLLGGGSRDDGWGCAHGSGALRWGGGGGVDRDGECDGGSFGTALFTLERGGGGTCEEAGRAGGGGAARFVGPSKEEPVGRGGGGGVPRGTVLDCESGGGGTLRGERLGGAVVASGGLDKGAATGLEGGGGTDRPIVEELIGGGGGAAGGGAARLGGSDGTTLLAAALDPGASVAAETETSNGEAGRARGRARVGCWKGRSGGGGSGSVRTDAITECGIDGGFPRPVIFADHQYQNCVQ